MASNFIRNDGEIDQSAEIVQLLSDMCMNDEHADVKLIVENTKIPAHKTILSARSSYFKSLLDGGFAEARQAVIELKVPLTAFRAILKYIYTGCLSLNTFEFIETVEICDLANQYGFDELKKMILDYLTENISLGNCVEILNAAHIFSMDELQNSCLIFMDVNSTELLGHDTFTELPLSSLCALLKRDTFYAPEVEIFNAICNWYAHNMNADIKEALSSVRWSKLSSDELINVIFRSNILDRAELLELMEENMDRTDRFPSSDKHTEQNIATPEFGAKVISGENPSALLNGNFTDYDCFEGCTYHPIMSVNMFHDRRLSQKLSTPIIVDLGALKFINYIELLLVDKDGRSYSYEIEVSLDGNIYGKLINYSNPVHRSWQYLYFQTRPIRFIKLVGTQAMDITKKRKGYDFIGNSREYISFDVVGLRAMYRKTNIPTLIDGVIKPLKNVATVECGATVIQGFGGNNMLNLKMGDFTCNEIGFSIIVQFNQPYVIDSLRILIGDSLNLSDKYSFCIETLLVKHKWEMAVDKKEEALTGWQEFDFPPRPAAYIKIVGTEKDINFICTYFECPRNPQKPCLKRSHP